MTKGWKLVGSRILLLAMLVTAALGGLVGAAGAAEVTVKAGQHATLGPILTDAEGLTLYYFTKDTAGNSVCYGTCEEKWPPLVVQAGETPTAAVGLTGKLGTTTRNDGKTQVTYDGMPLYYWWEDMGPGDALGQGVGGVWYVIEAGSPTVLVSQHASYGEILTGPNGLTLYTFAKDTPNTSNCAGACLDKWPPLIVEGEPVAPSGLKGSLGTITRGDGRVQVTYNSMPLYYWYLDAAPGETKGHGVNKIWFVANVNLFPDTVGHWGNLDVAAAAKAGWVGGYPDGSFKPDGTVTRAEFLQMLTVAYGFKTATTAGSFTDLADHWSKGAVEAAVTAGVVLPAEYAGGTFGPDRVITREEIARFVVRAAGLKGGDEALLKPFTDTSQISADARSHLAAAVGAKIVGGYPDSTIRPTATATRGEAVVMLQRALKLNR